MSEETTNNPPFGRVKSRCGRIEIAIWRKENDQGFANYSFTAPQRSYKDKETGEYVRTTTIFEEDAAELSLMYADVRNQITQAREADYQERRQPQVA